MPSRHSKPQAEPSGIFGHDDTPVVHKPRRRGADPDGTHARERLRRKSAARRPPAAPSSAPPAIPIASRYESPGHHQSSKRLSVATTDSSAGNLEDRPVAQAQAQILPAKPWACIACTFENTNGAAMECVMCETPRQLQKSLEQEEKPKEKEDTRTEEVPTPSIPTTHPSSNRRVKEEVERMERALKVKEEKEEEMVGEEPSKPAAVVELKPAPRTSTNQESEVEVVKEEPSKPAAVVELKKPDQVPPVAATAAGTKAVKSDHEDDSVRSRSYEEEGNTESEEEAEESSGGRWPCSACAFDNEPTADSCLMCATQRDEEIQNWGSLIVMSKDQKQDISQQLETVIAQKAQRTSLLAPMKDGDDDNEEEEIEVPPEPIKPKKQIFRVVTASSPASPKANRTRSSSSPSLSPNPRQTTMSPKLGTRISPFMPSLAGPNGTHRVRTRTSSEPEINLAVAPEPEINLEVATRTSSAPEINLPLAPLSEINVVRAKGKGHDDDNLAEVYHVPAQIRVKQNVPKPAPDAAGATAATPKRDPESDDQAWACGACTFLNAAHKDSCEVCQTSKPKKAEPERAIKPPAMSSLQVESSKARNVEVLQTIGKPKSSKREPQSRDPEPQQGYKPDHSPEPRRESPVPEPKPRRQLDSKPKQEPNKGMSDLVSAPLDEVTLRAIDKPRPSKRELQSRDPEPRRGYKSDHSPEPRRKSPVPEPKPRRQLDSKPDQEAKKCMSAQVPVVVPVPIPVPPSESQPVHISTDDHSVESLETADSIEIASFPRAEFICAVIVRESANEKLGISLKSKSGRLVISKLKNDGRFGTSPLRIGDKLLTINGESCVAGNLDEAGAISIFRTHVGRLTIVAHNEGGESQVVETTIERPTKKQSLGLRMKPNVDGLEVTNAKGLFVDTLVKVGDSIVAVNQVETGEVPLEKLDEVIKQSPRLLRLRTETELSAADFGVKAVSAPVIETKPLILVSATTDSHSIEPRREQPVPRPQSQSAPQSRLPVNLRATANVVGQIGNVAEAVVNVGEAVNVLSGEEENKPDFASQYTDYCEF